MQSNQIGVDTESNSLYAYREQVCLLQLSNKQGDFLLDPLAKVDIQEEILYKFNNSMHGIKNPNLYPDFELSFTQLKIVYLIIRKGEDLSNKTKIFTRLETI